MTPIEFKHDGRTYSVRPLNELQSSLSSLMMLDICLAITGAEWEDAPKALRTLIMHYVNWSLCTEIDGEVQFDYLNYTQEAPFKAFVLSITGDNELFTKWSNAHKEANLEQVDPNASSGEPQAETE